MVFFLTKVTKKIFPTKPKYLESDKVKEWLEKLDVNETISAINCWGSPGMIDYMVQESERLQELKEKYKKMSEKEKEKFLIDLWLKEKKKKKDEKRREKEKKLANEDMKWYVYNQKPIEPLPGKLHKFTNDKIEKVYDGYRILSSSHCSINCIDIIKTIENKSDYVLEIRFNGEYFDKIQPHSTYDMDNLRIYLAAFTTFDICIIRENNEKIQNASVEVTGLIVYKREIPKNSIPWKQNWAIGSGLIGKNFLHFEEIKKECEEKIKCIDLYLIPDLRNIIVKYL